MDLAVVDRHRFFDGLDLDNAVTVIGVVPDDDTFKSFLHIGILVLLWHVSGVFYARFFLQKVGRNDCR